MFIVFICLFCVVASAATLNDIHKKLGKKKEVKEQSGEIVFLGKKEVSELPLSSRSKVFYDSFKTGWKHARMGSYVFNYRKNSTMKKLAKLVERIYGEIYIDLHPGEVGEVSSFSDTYIYILEDERKWKQFLDKVYVKNDLVGIAEGREIFIYFDWNDMDYRGFAIRLLAREITKIAIEDIYSFVPVWIREGFARYEEDKTSDYIKLAYYVGENKWANKAGMYSIEELTELEYIPFDEGREGIFFMQAQRLVEFFYLKSGKGKFVNLLKVFQATRKFRNAVMKVYKDEYPTFKILLARANEYK